MKSNLIFLLSLLICHSLALNIANWAQVQSLKKTEYGLNLIQMVTEAIDHNVKVDNIKASLQDLLEGLIQDQNDSNAYWKEKVDELNEEQVKLIKRLEDINDTIPVKTTEAEELVRKIEETTKLIKEHNDKKNKDIKLLDTLEKNMEEEQLKHDEIIKSNEDLIVTLEKIINELHNLLDRIPEGHKGEEQQAQAQEQEQQAQEQEQQAQVQVQEQQAQAQVQVQEQQAQVQGKGHKKHQQVQQSLQPQTQVQQDKDLTVGQVLKAAGTGVKNHIIDNTKSDKTKEIVSGLGNIFNDKVDNYQNKDEKVSNLPWINNWLSFAQTSDSDDDSLVISKDDTNSILQVIEILKEVLANARDTIVKRKDYMTSYKQKYAESKSHLEAEIDEMTKLLSQEETDLAKYKSESADVKAIIDDLTAEKETKDKELENAKQEIVRRTERYQQTTAVRNNQREHIIILLRTIDEELSDIATFLRQQEKQSN